MYWLVIPGTSTVPYKTSVPGTVPGTGYMVTCRVLYGRGTVPGNRYK